MYDTTAEFSDIDISAEPMEPELKTYLHSINFIEFIILFPSLFIVTTKR